MRVARTVAADPGASLPAWDDWGELFADGILVVGLLLFWSLAPLMLIFCGITPSIWFMSSSAFDTGPSTTNWGAVIGIVVVLFILFAMIAVISFYLTEALGRAAVRRSLGEGTDPSGTHRIVRAHAPLFLAVFVLESGLWGLTYYLDFVAWIGFLIGYAYAVPAIFHLIGQAQALVASPVPQSSTPTPDRPAIDLVTPIRRFVTGPGWKRRLLGPSVLVALPLVGWIPLLGYATRLTRHAARPAAETSAALPGWTNWRALTTDGARILVAVSLCWLPVWLITTAVDQPAASGVGAVAAIGLVTDRSNGGPESTSPRPVLIESITTLAANAAILAGYALTLLVVGRVAAFGSLRAGFQYQAIRLAVQRSPARFAVGFVVQFSVVSSVGYGVFDLGLGLLPAVALGVFVLANLYGQLHAPPDSDAPIPTIA